MQDNPSEQVQLLWDPFDDNHLIPGVPVQKKRIIIVNPGFTTDCGVYQHGRRFFRNLKEDISAYRLPYTIDITHVTTTEDYDDAVNQMKWDLVIVNYYNQQNMPYVTPPSDSPNRIVGILHEFGEKPDGSEGFPFRETIHCWNNVATTLPNWHYFPRPLARHLSFLPSPNDKHNPNAINIGSFGYYFPNKGYERVLEAASKYQRSTGKPVQVNLLLNKPTYSGYDDAFFHRALQSLHLIAKSLEIQLVITNKDYSDIRVVDYLARNDINAFLYDENNGRGLSSALDFAIPARKPLLLSNSSQFRHMENHINANRYPKATIESVLQYSQYYTPRYYTDNNSTFLNSLMNYTPL